MTAERLLVEHREAVDRVTGVFVEHQRMSPALIGAEWHVACLCLWVSDAPGDYLTHWTQHRDAHLASVLADAERAARADELEQAALKYDISVKHHVRRWLRDRAAAVREGDR